MLKTKFIRGAAVGIIIFTLLMSTGCSSSSSNGFEDYFCNIDYVYDLHIGILGNNKEFESGNRYEITYDFDAEEYQDLEEKYNILEIAGEGTEFERAVRLMDEFAPGLKHHSNYDNHISFNAIDLLDYSLNQPKNGINCLNKSKILCEMCLACGIYVRRVYIFPYNANDQDNHVVIEVYDSSYEKWIMLDMSNDIYFVNESNEPLSLLEIREAGAEGDFCTAMSTEYEMSVEDAFNDYMGLNTYIMKDVFYFIYDSENGFGISDDHTYYYLIPENFDISNWYTSKGGSNADYYESYEFEIISKEVVMETPEM